MKARSAAMRGRRWPRIAALISGLPEIGTYDAQVG
jgi:hypothetical protein